MVTPVTSEDEEDENVESHLRGEFAMDMFIDPIDFGDPHPILKTKTEDRRLKEERLKGQSRHFLDCFIARKFLLLTLEPTQLHNFMIIKI